MSDANAKDAKKQAYLARLRGEIAPQPDAPAPATTPNTVKTPADLQNLSQGSNLANERSAGDHIPGFSARIGTNTVKRIGEVVEEHPDKALAILRNWMSQ